MQTMLLADHIRTSGRNALLRTASHAFSAANAGIADHKSLLSFADRSSPYRVCSQVEPLHLFNADAKWLQDVTAVFGIDLVHGWVFLKDAVDPLFLIRKVLSLTAETEHLESFIQACDCHIFLLT